MYLSIKVCTYDDIYKIKNFEESFVNTKSQNKIISMASAN